MHICNCTPSQHYIARLPTKCLFGSNILAMYPHFPQQRLQYCITQNKPVSSETKPKCVCICVHYIQINDNVLSEIFETKNRGLYDKLVIPIAKKYNIGYQTSFGKNDLGGLCSNLWGAKFRYKELLNIETWP